MAEKKCVDCEWFNFDVEMGHTNIECSLEKWSMHLQDYNTDDYDNEKVFRECIKSAKDCDKYLEAKDE